MSQEPLRAGPASDDAITSGDRSVIDHARAPIGSRPPSRRPHLRARPQSWHPYGPVEPPLELSASRPIGVHAILNPMEQAAAEPNASSSREPLRLSLPGPSSSPRPRQGSSPGPHSARPLAQQPLSPKSHSRPVMNPGSPPPRFISSGRTSGRSSISHSPLVPQEPAFAPRQPISSSPLPLDTALRSVTALPGTQPPSSTALHSTPNIHSRRTSTGPGPLTRPNSQAASPVTPHSGYNHFGRAPPAVGNISLPPSTTPTPHSTAPPYMTVESMSRGMSATAGPHSMTEERGGAASAPSTTTPLGGLIPCVLDLKSGSSSQAEKRKANSDASRRFRNRKRNEMQLEQRLNAQQEEIQRHVETVRRQTEEIRSLVQQRNHYRSERDFFRDQLGGRSMSLSQLPQRPPTPPSTQPSLHPIDTAGPPAWVDVPRNTPAVSGHGAPPQVLDPARPQSSWPGSPGSYSPAPPVGRSSVPAPPPPVAGGQLPPFQGSWSRP